MQTDRVPINYMAESGIDRRLKAFYGVSSERELLDVLGADFYFISARDISQNETFMPIYRGPKLDYTETERTCPLGIRFLRKVRDSKFGADEALTGPLRNAKSEQDILSHSWPKASWFDVDALREECTQFSDKVIIGGFWSAILGDSYRMHGFENFLLNLSMNPRLIRTLVRRVTDFYLELNERAFSALKGKLDIFFFGNDFGSQNGLLFSRQMWEDVFYQPYRELATLAHSYGLKVMSHSCGGISEILDLLIDAGIEILDPVQTTAAGMDTEGLKARFGGKIVFHGAIDTQHVLPRGSVEDVRRHVEETIRVLGRHGGYVMTSCNSMQNDTPVQNIDTMYETARTAADKEQRN